MWCPEGSLISYRLSRRQSPLILPLIVLDLLVQYCIGELLLHQLEALLLLHPQSLFLNAQTFSTTLPPTEWQVFHEINWHFDRHNLRQLGGLLWGAVVLAEDLILRRVGGQHIQEPPLVRDVPLSVDADQLIIMVVHEVPELLQQHALCWVASDRLASLFSYIEGTRPVP